MELLHETVEHKRFGSGTVTSFDGHALTVSFEGLGEKTFSYPSAFGQFLTARSEEVQAEAEALIRQSAEKNLEVIGRAEQEIAQLREQARHKGGTRKSAAKKPAASKAKKT